MKKLQRQKGPRWKRFVGDFLFADLPDGTRATVERTEGTAGDAWSAYRAGKLVAKGLKLRAAQHAAETGEAP